MIFKAVAKKCKRGKDTYVHSLAGIDFCCGLMAKAVFDYEIISISSFITIGSKQEDPQEIFAEIKSKEDRETENIKYCPWCGAEIKTIWHKS